MPKQHRKLKEVPREVRNAKSRRQASAQTLPSGDDNEPARGDVDHLLPAESRSVLEDDEYEWDAAHDTPPATGEDGGPRDSTDLEGHTVEFIEAAHRYEEANPRPAKESAVDARVAWLAGVLFDGFKASIQAGGRASSGSATTQFTVQVHELAQKLRRTVELPPGPADEAANRALDKLRRGELRLLTAATALDQLFHRPNGLPTQVDGIDFSTGGGLHPAALTVFQGPPGAGKTTLVAQIVHQLCLSGVAALWIAVDEQAMDIAARLAQQAGAPAMKLYDRSDNTGIEVGKKLVERLPILLIDADGRPVEPCIREFSERYPGRQRVVVVDSLQTAHAEVDDDGGRDPRARVERLIEVLKYLANAASTTCAVLATSELARGAYRSSNRSLQTDPIAASKESGAIEYRTHTLFDLRSVAKLPGFVDVTAVKVRGWGTTRGHRFRLQLNRDRARFEVADELPLPTQHVEDLATKVLQYVRNHPDCGTNDVTTAVVGRATEVRAALKKLQADGQLSMATGPSNKHLWREPTDAKSTKQLS